MTPLLNLRVLISVIVFSGGVLLAIFATSAEVRQRVHPVTMPSGRVEQSWVAQYGLYNHPDVARAIAVDSSGNVYVTGTSDGYATIKYNSAGQQQWIAHYDGAGGVAIAVDGSGNIYVTGQKYIVYLQGLSEYATIKYNPDGQQQWVALYHGPTSLHDRATAIAVDASGNVYVTGESGGQGTGSDYATIKYNSAGQQQWVARYDGPGSGDDAVVGIGVDGVGNAYVTGTSYGGGGDCCDYATVKYSPTGQQLWVARYSGPENGQDGPSGIAVDGSGNVYVTGTSFDAAGTNSDYATVKYNSAGQQQWVARYDGGGVAGDEAQAIAVDASGNVYVTGVSDGAGTNVDYATIKYNSAGQEQWLARYNGPTSGPDGAYAIALDHSGNVYVTGASEGAYATVMYTSAGQQRWAARYGGGGYNGDTAWAIAVDDHSNVYVTGITGIGVTADYLTIKYSNLPTHVPRPTPPPHITPIPPPPSPRPTAAPRPSP
jgi:hypothetical protein